MSKLKEPTLRELRESNNKSRSEVATALGVTANAITNYESGFRSISLEQVISLAKLYDCTAESVIYAQIESIRVGKTK